MGLDTLAEILSGRRETVFWYPGSVAGLASAIPFQWTFIDAQLGITLPATLAGEFPTDYYGVPALTAPARVIDFSGWGTNRSMNALYDRLWVSGRVTGTGGAIDSGDMPARSSNGEGYLLYFTCRAAGDAPSGLSPAVTYTNSQGVTGRTATPFTAMPANSVGTMIPFVLQDDDTGIKSVQSVSNADITTNGYQLVIARRVTKEPLTTPDIGVSASPTVQGRNRGRLLMTMTSILPVGTVLVPSHQGTTQTANVAAWQATLAYG